ncbi:MAG: hypothetical protein IT328_10040 [Caldilineaceae bacterium]|nr:hypothetical protein [Caldilineaceae bacterium]
MFARTLIISLLLLGITGCAAAPRYRGIAAGSSSEYVLGLSVDADLRVVEVTPASAAERAGVQVGDQLVSLTWILSERPEELGGSQGIVAVDDGAAPIIEGEVVTETADMLSAQAAGGSGTVPFTDRAEIRTLLSYGVPLRLRVLRAEQMLRLTVIPALPTEGSGDAAPATTEATAHETF